MSRFNTSKFKNAAAKIPKREQWVNDLNVGSPASYGNHITASCTLMAFNTSITGGGTLSVLPLDKCGRGMSSEPMLHAHSSQVTDMDFSPFGDYVLATCSTDCTIKLWEIPEGGLKENMTAPVLTLPKQPSTVQNVLFHPTAEAILASSCQKTLHLWDVAKAQEQAAMSVHDDEIQSLSWKTDGSLVATTSKDTKLRILDPRSNSICAVTDNHPSNKPGRVCWLGSGDRLLTTGFSKRREREVCVWDQRQFSQAVGRLSVDQSQGTLIPLFDPDTNMLFLVGKGDQSIRYLDVTQADPFIVNVNVQQVPDVTKGVAMVPKRALDVMACEVARLLQLTATAVLPIPYIVPRKSHREFYSELFPETAGGDAPCSTAEWLTGSNQQVAKISLDPSKRTPLRKKTVSIPTPESATVQETREPVHHSLAKASDGVQEATAKLKTSSIAAGSRSQNEPSRQGGTEKKSDVKPPVEEKPKKFVAPTTSKFRHMASAVLPKSTHMFNLHNLRDNMSGESDIFYTNLKWGAVPLGGPGGMIGFVDLTKPGKLERDLPAVQNGPIVMDYAWDPFNHNQLAVGCDNAKIHVWNVPADGWSDTMTKPTAVLRGHQEKIYFVKYHPQASDVLLSASYDMTVKIWDLSSGEDRITLQGHTDQIFSGAWSQDGSKVATVCKDGKVRVYEPRSSAAPVKEGSGPPGSRGARLVWACEDECLLVTGFDRMSERTVGLYSVADTITELKTITLDKSPSILIPFYDQDTSVVFLTGKGALLVLGLEVLSVPPYFMNLAPLASTVPHQALSFLPKYVCNVKDVEFAKAFRLTQTSIEPVTFTVPRVKKEYFQDDIFPEARVTWKPALTGLDWFAGADGVQERISLCPKDMKLLSSIPKLTNVPLKYHAEVELAYKTDEQKKEELLSAMNTKLAAKNEPLPQEACEGVEDDEWDD